MQKRKCLIASVLVLCLLLASMCCAVSEDTGQGMRIEDGMARQIVSYTSAQSLDYSNADSEILRLVVYVETDYDTDLDGKPDLIKAVVQVPRPAAEGVYRAPVIYEARPYIAGIDLYQPSLPAPGTAPFDSNTLRGQPEKRVPKGSMSTVEAALQANPSDWYYKFDNDFYDLQYMQNLTIYDDLLVCGYAVVQSAGLGTWGSEGIECCGTDLEAEAFRCVVEWLTGKRTAYTDRINNIQIEADWSSGSIGMTGRSYAGAMAYEVACTGVEGLKTIVSVAGVASWYSYLNAQGIPSGLFDVYGSMPKLAIMCSSRFFSGADAELLPLFEQYLAAQRDEEIRLAGDYGDYWAERDFSSRCHFQGSALLVQGFNDVSVHPDQFDRMRSALMGSGCEVKAILHQNGHVSPANEQTKTDILIGTHTYTEWLNLWFTHTLLGVDNEAVQLPSLLVQSNTDGTFSGSEAWNSSTMSMTCEEKAEYTVHAENAHMSNTDLVASTMDGSSSTDHLVWSIPVTEPLIIAGTPTVHVRAKTENVDTPLLMMSAVLVDHAESSFHSYGYQWAEVLDQEILEENAVNRGVGVEPYSLARWKETLQDRKIIGFGSIDLHNPEADYAPSTCTTRETPIESGAWYDYTLYLQPNYYTVPAGHTLELYVVPFCGFSNDSAFYDTLSEEELTELGFDHASMIPFVRNYSFTVDLSSLKVNLPVADKTDAAPEK